MTGTVYSTEFYIQGIQPVKHCPQCGDIVNGDPAFRLFADGVLLADGFCDNGCVRKYIQAHIDQRIGAQVADIRARGPGAMIRPLKARA
jgi:hypothetical protein